jgi:Xaa-Pro aminopeptidase
MTVILPTPGYSRDERDRRWRIAQELMELVDLEALVIFGEREGAAPAPFAFDAYFTNDRPGTIVVIPRGADPVALVPLPTYASVHHESSLRGDAVWIAPEDVRPARHPDGIVDVLREHRASHGTIGIVGLEPYPPYHFLPPLPGALRVGLCERLPDATLLPVGERLAMRMLRQSDEELAVVRHAAGIGDVMAEAVRSAARPGAAESEVYSAGMRAAHELGSANARMTLWSGRGSVAWGPPPWAYRPQRPRRLAAGDVVHAGAFVSYGMKETEQHVAIAIGEPDPAFGRAADVARDSYRIGLRALRPGALFGDVVAAMQAPVATAGGSLIHTLVRGVNPSGAIGGVAPALPACYGAGAGFATQLGDLVIEPGMTFVLSPNCAFGRHAASIGGTVIVRDDGPEELNPASADVLRNPE